MTKLNPKDRRALNISDKLRTLDDRECSVLKLRYGLGKKGNHHSSDEIAHTLGVTRETVRRIIVSAKEKLLNKQVEI